MHGVVTPLSGNIFVEGVLGDTLHVVDVFGCLLHAFAWEGREQGAAIRR